MSSASEPLHKRLKRLRERNGLTVKEVARGIEVPESTYREWEYGRGLRVPPFEKIASLLMVSTTELVTGKKPEVDGLLTALQKIEEVAHEIRMRIGSIN